MIITINNEKKIVNSSRLVSAMINPVDEKEIIYMMSDGQFFKEEFEDTGAATTAFEGIKVSTLVELTNNRKINGIYVKDVIIDPLDNKKVVFVMYNGAPQREKYESKELAEARISEVVSELKSATEFEDGGDPSDLSNYYTKTQVDGKFAEKTELEGYVQTVTAEETYAKKSEIPTATSQLSNDSNFVVDADYVHTDANFTSELKGKLDGLNNYVLPTANGSTLGGIKLGTGLTDVGEGVINVDFSSITSQISALEGRVEALESKSQA